MKNSYNEGEEIKVFAEDSTHYNYSDRKQKSSYHGPEVSRED